MKTIKCFTCNGRGETPATELFRGRRVQIAIHCGACGGTGEVQIEWCDLCNNTCLTEAGDLCECCMTPEPACSCNGSGIVLQDAVPAPCTCEAGEAYRARLHMSVEGWERFFTVTGGR